MKTINKQAMLLILGGAICAVSLSACGVKMGSGVVLGTTSFLEEVNAGLSNQRLMGQGTHTEVIQERITGQDRARLQAKLDEVN
jgi:hypothetical protein